MCVTFLWRYRGNELNPNWRFSGCILMRQSSNLKRDQFIRNIDGVFWKIFFFKKIFAFIRYWIRSRSASSRWHIHYATTPHSMGLKFFSALRLLINYLMLFWQISDPLFLGNALIYWALCSGVIPRHPPPLSLHNLCHQVLQCLIYLLYNYYERFKARD